MSNQPASLPEYDELLEIARESATQLFRSALWDKMFTEFGGNDSIEAAIVVCQKLGLDVSEIEADFNAEWIGNDEEDDDGDV